MRRLRQMQQTRGGAGGGPQVPKGSPLIAVGGALLLGGAYVLSNSLFNVDGGQRAIKYQRLNGVSKEIYNEGEQSHAKYSSPWQETLSCYQESYLLTELDT